MEKVILVTPGEDYSDYFKAEFPDWNIARVDTLPEMWSGLQTNVIPDDSSIIIFNAAYYGNSYGDIEQAIETLHEHATVFVISYSPENEAQIREKLKEQYPGVNHMFYFIRAENPVGDVVTGLKSWIEFKKNNTNAVASDGLPQPKDLEDIISKVGNVVSNLDLPPLDKRGIIVASTSSKGGSGKTTVALCTASALYHSSRLAAEQGLRDRPFNVVVVDLDVRDGQVGFLLGKDKPTVLNLWIQNRQEPEADKIKDFLHYHEGMGIWALLAPINSKTAGLVKPEYYQKLLYNLSLMFDVVIVDTSVNYLEKLLSKVVLPMVDTLMFVTNMSKGSVFGMTRWVKNLVDGESVKSEDDEDTKISKDKIGIIINQAMENVGVGLNDILSHGIGIELMTAIPSDGAAVVKATNEYKLQDIVLNHPTISDKYFVIAKKIVKNMGQPDAYIISPQSGAVFARKELLDKLKGGDMTAEYEKENPLAPKRIGG